MLSQKKKPLTFGDWVAGVYAVYGKQKAKRIVRLAVNTHLVEFHGRDRFMIFEPGSDNSIPSI